MCTGGAETMLVDIANEQAARGNDVTLLVINDRYEDAVLAGLGVGVRLVKFNRRPGSSRPAAIVRLNMFIRKTDPEVVHLHAHNLPPFIFFGKRRSLLTIHDVGTSLRFTGRIKLAAISTAVADYIKSVKPDADVTTVENGINTSLVLPRVSAPLRAGSPVRIVQVARLNSEKKGQDILIDALALLRCRGINATVTFIGDGADRAELEARAARAGIAPYVIFEGSQPRGKVYSHLRDFDIMCHPSRFEGFGLTVAEGMAAGLPLIVSEGDGPWEVADRGRLCRPFLTGDAAACADALQYVTERYPEALALAEEAKAYVARKYSVSRMVDEYMAMYQSLAAH